MPAPDTEGVRPGTGVVRPGTGVVPPAGAAKARAVVPEAGEAPAGPIHIVLPVIPVKPAKQSFLDKLIAPRSKKKKDKEKDGPAEIPTSPAPAPAPAPPAPSATPPTSPAAPTARASAAAPAPLGTTPAPKPPAAAPPPPPPPVVAAPPEPSRFEVPEAPDEVDFPELPTPEARRPEPDVRRPEPDVRRPDATTDVRRPEPDVRRPDATTDVRRPEPEGRPAAGQARPVEPRPIEQRPVEQRPVEQRPVEQRPVEQRPVEQRADTDVRRPDQDVRRPDVRPVEPPRHPDQDVRRPDVRPVEPPRHPGPWPANEQSYPDVRRPDSRPEPPQPQMWAGPPAPPVERPPARPTGPARPGHPGPGGWGPEAPTRPAGPQRPAPPRAPRSVPVPEAFPSESSPYPDEEYFEAEPRRQRQPSRGPVRRRPEPVSPAPEAVPGRQRNWRGPLVAVAVILTVVAGLGGGLAGRMGQTGTRWVPTALAGGPAGPVLGTLGANAPVPSQAGLSARIGGMLADARLGSHVTASVIDVSTGDSLYDVNGGGAAEPASTTKLATAAAVLSARGPSYRIPTRVIAGPGPGEVVLIGGGDPTLAAGGNGTYPGAGRLDKLADQVKRALGGTAPTRVIVDSSLFSGSTLGPGWFEQDAKDGFTAHITALMTDGARKNPRQLKQAPRFDQPDVAAGQLFARALGLPASAVVIQPGAGGGGGQELGQVLSPTIGRLVEMMLLESDNVIAECLARQVAIVRGLPATFAGGAEATRAALTDLAIPTDGYGLVDGSGLSHLNKLSASLLTAVLAKASSPEHPELRSIVTGLPVAAYSGTLNDRFRGANAGGSGAGTVHAKTGTLNGVSTLAGMAVDADGRLLAFSVMADGVRNTYSAQIALDRIAAAIAGCGCQ